MEIISVRENPDFCEKAVDFFTEAWKIDRNIYKNSIEHSLTAEGPIPQWYLLLKEEKIIGGFGIIMNDFISRQDLYPWFCALYVKESERGSFIGSLLLQHGQKEAKRLGFKTLYLCTDHISYYEKYGWEYVGTGFHPWGDESRIYQIKT